MGYPTSSDGRQIMLSSKYRGDYQQWFPGASDSEAGKGKGALFGISMVNTLGDSTPHVMSWDDPIYIGGGYCKYEGAKFGDHIRFRFYAPATVPAATEPAGEDFNCRLVAIGGGMNLIVPAVKDAQTDPATHHMDLTGAGGAVVPIPDANMGNKNAAGLWDYTNPDEGMGVLSPNPTGKGDWNLFDFSTTLVDYVPKMPLLGSDIVSYAVDVNPKKILPQWRGEVVLYSCDNTHTVEAVWWMEAARKKTY